MLPLRAAKRDLNGSTPDVALVASQTPVRTGSRGSPSATFETIF